MRRLLNALMLLVAVLFPALSSAQSATITFKASHNTHDEDPVSNAYARFYAPGESIAMDSLFSGVSGDIEIVLPFSWSGPDAIKEFAFDPRILQPISPNLVDATDPSPVLHYSYQSDARLYLVDMQGKVYENRSALSPGLYYYYLVFEDGIKSRFHKLVLAADCNLNITLVNDLQTTKQDADHENHKKRMLEDAFSVEIIKNGFITHWDTVQINSSVIERTYILTAADIPTANFTWQGDLIAGNPVSFDGTVSSGAHGEELLYSWDFAEPKQGLRYTIKISGCLPQQQLRLKIVS